MVYGTGVKVKARGPDPARNTIISGPRDPFTLLLLMARRYEALITRGMVSRLSIIDHEEFR